MPELFKKVFFYKTKVNPKLGLSTDIGDIFNHPIDNNNDNSNPIGTLSTFIICPKIISNIPKYKFLPYITNKTIVTPGGVISFLYQVVNNDDADCKILNKSGVFKDVIAIKRVIISSKNGFVIGKYILTFKK